jgi:iron complex transport system substrate-binding protein
MRKLLQVLLLVAGSTALTSFLPAADTSDTLANARIVSLSSSATEVLYELGLGDRLVGRDATSVHPPEVFKLPEVGYHRQIAAEGVAALNPTHLIGTTEAGPPVVLDQLRTTGADVKLFPVDQTIESHLALMISVGELVGKGAEVKAMASRIGEQLDEVELRTRGAEKPRVLFIYARGGGTLNVGGSGTKGDALIRAAGGVNAFASQEGFKPLTAESVVEANPDVVFILERGLKAAGGTDGVLQLPGIALTKAGAEKRVVSLEDTFALGFGPRTGDAIVAMAKLLHPTRFDGATE